MLGNKHNQVWQRRSRQWNLYNIPAYPKGPNHSTVNTRSGSKSQGLTAGQTAVCETVWLALWSGEAQAAQANLPALSLAITELAGIHLACSIPGDHGICKYNQKTAIWVAVCILGSQWTKLPALGERPVHYLVCSTALDWQSYTRGAEFIIFVRGKKASLRKINK